MWQSACSTVTVAGDAPGRWHRLGGLAAGVGCQATRLFLNLLMQRISATPTSLIYRENYRPGRLRWEWAGFAVQVFAAERRCRCALPTQDCSPTRGGDLVTPGRTAENRPNSISQSGCRSRTIARPSGRSCAQPLSANRRFALPNWRDRQMLVIGIALIGGPCRRELLADAGMDG
jgi:hypothetical protein